MNPGPATVNTGGGGGGCRGQDNSPHGDGSDGGTGVVIVRYKFQ